MSESTTQESPRDAIANVIGYYSRAVDERDFETVGRCFTHDAIASYSGLTIPQGREHIVEHITGITRTQVSQHYLLPIIIEVAPDGMTAKSLCYGLAVLVQDKDGEPSSLGRGLQYADEWRLTDEGWQITNRLHTANWQWELPARLDPGAMWKVKPDTAGETIYRTLRQEDAV